MKFIPALALVMLLGAGCINMPGSTDRPEPGPETPTGAHPPAITMKADGKAVVGVEGSYCTAMMCVDKVGPKMLVEQANLDFVAVSRTNLTFAIDADVAELSVGLIDTNGQSVLGSDGSAVADAEGNFTYSVPAKVKAGNYYLNAFASFETGGDVSYVFPITIK